MGYLYDNLPFGRNIAPCPDFYIYAMFVYFQRADKYAALKPKTILAQVIGTVLSNVEDWQLAASRPDFIVFRFHDPNDRIAAQNAILAVTPVELVITKITFSQTGSTVLPSGQVFPAPAPPPPPFPDLGPIITNLETQVNQLNIEVAELQAAKTFWLPPVAAFADLPTGPTVMPGSVALTLDTGQTWQYTLGDTWEPFVGSGGATAGIIRPYSAGVIVQDAVYQKSDGTVSPASAVGESFMPCIGFVTALDSPTTGFCVIQQTGDLPGFTGLSAGDIYIVSKNLGQILWEGDVSNPDYPGSMEFGTIVQAVGIASSATTLNVQLMQQETN